MTKANHQPKICATCGASFIPTGPRSTYCSSCAKLRAIASSKERHRRTYVKKGYNQSKEKNNNWKGGIGIYRDLISVDACTSCGSTRNLCVHHIDENRRNNTSSNLECLCKKCHQLRHRCWEALPKGAALSDLKKMQAASAKRDVLGKFC